VLKKYNYTSYFTPGSYIDAKDTCDNWMVAKIIKTDGKNIEINFDGWNKKWNLTYNMASRKVAAFKNQTPVYTG
jgi:hypothetical protein